MRIFLAGARGVIGVRLVPLLVAAGHEVAGMTRTPGNAERLSALGAEPVVCDVFRAEAVEAAVRAFRTELVMHQLTDLPDDRARIRELADGNSRVRREATRNLLAAAESAGVRRFLAQSVAWAVPGDGGAAVEEHERAVLDAHGVVLRYGQFYGPGTYYEDEPPHAPRVHIDTAARRTVGALDTPSGVQTIVDEAADAQA